MVKLDWEEMDGSGDYASNKCYRCKVVGGWLVLVTELAYQTGGLTFVPDPQHQWT